MYGYCHHEHLDLYQLKKKKKIIRYGLFMRNCIFHGKLHVMAMNGEMLGANFHHHVEGPFSSPMSI